MTEEKHTSDDEVAQRLGLDKTHSGHRWYRRWWVIALLLIVLVLTGVKWLSRNETQAQAYQTVLPQRGDITVTVTATGTLQPVNQVDVGSEVSGTIRDVLVDFNDRVKKGDALAVMDTDQLIAQVKQAKASLALAEAKVKQAEATVIEKRNTLRRSIELKKSGMCSEQDCDAAQANFDRAEADLASARAQVVQAQAALDAQQTTFKKATIVSPIDGIVLNRDVEPGQTVAASFQTPVLFTLAENLTQMELHVSVDEADVGKVQVGQLARFTVDAYPQRTFPAEISEVHFASQTVDGVVTYETVLHVDNSDLLLRPGMTATADITVQRVSDALMVANAALYFIPAENNTQSQKKSGGLLGSLLPRPPRQEKKQPAVANTGKRLWILRDGQPQAIAVKTGVSDGVNTQIISDQLTVDDQVITDSTSR